MRGALEKGKYADMVVLNRAHMGVPGDKTDEIEPMTTIVDGGIVYAARQEGAPNRTQRSSPAPGAARRRHGDRDRTSCGGGR